jgi:hypothetical protein
MAKKKPKMPAHKFSNKLLLNQWLISLFGIDPLQAYRVEGRRVRPFHLLIDPIKDPRMEGLDNDNLHKFYYNFVNSSFFWDTDCRISKAQILAYEQNIVRHTLMINDKRDRQVNWKYFQWLGLLFCEIYLDRYFNDTLGLLDDLNEYVKRFNQHWSDYADIPAYTEDDLNKLCFQCATGSGKTLLMHVNLLQYRHYAKQTGKDKDLSRVILLTPNERLSEQHLGELRESGITAGYYMENRGAVYGSLKGLDQVDILEITKLADQKGPNTVEARELSDQNLLLVDEGHRGMSGTEEGVWFTRRSYLCSKGFTFEYSATFEQAVAASKRADFENTYAKTVIFDYAYRWFYEDGFGKDYQILNLPRSFDQARKLYLTACLLKFYQQIKIYQESYQAIQPFNIEKPLWVFVGSTVTKAKGGNKTEKEVAADVAQIIQFIADFTADPEGAKSHILDVLTRPGKDTGLLDNDNNDIFGSAFIYLKKHFNPRESINSLYQDIMRRLFNNPAGGRLELSRIKGESGEILLKVGTTEEPFGLINVGDSLGLANHCAEVCKNISVEESDFSESIFASVKNSASPINMLIGSKKFVEGWDCWRVSTMGLMHVGKTEGAQIIQLFGRGIRLKGYQWSLKRSGRSLNFKRPMFIEELETLNVFGIEADFMERFRDYLKEEGLPGNEKRETILIPLNVTYDFGKHLKTLRPKRKAADAQEYDFKKDGPIPSIGDLPDIVYKNFVEVDWYPRIQKIASRGRALASEKEEAVLEKHHIAFLDSDELYFELEQFKRERSWHNLNISKKAILDLLANPCWYRLYLPSTRLNPERYDGILLLQQVAIALLKRYCENLYNYRKREYIKPRLEMRELSKDDPNFPSDEEYQLIVDGDETQLIIEIQQIKKEIEEKKDFLTRINTPGDLKACNWAHHLYQPLFHVRKGGKITIMPVALNKSEYRFVEDLKSWCEENGDALIKEKQEIFLLRNISRKGIGFFEAGSFYPDFILWLLTVDKQFVSFIEPHGLLHEGPGSNKVQFSTRIKEVEQRLGDPSVILNSFILSWTPFAQLQWGISQSELENMHVLLMNDDREQYIGKLFSMLN